MDRMVRGTLTGFGVDAKPMCTYVSHFPHQEGAAIMNMFTLEHRRLKGDMIELLKIHRGLDRIYFDKLFTTADMIKQPRNGLIDPLLFDIL